jgi:hypothetical protein
MFNQDISHEISSTDVEIHSWNGKDDPDNPYIFSILLVDYHNSPLTCTDSIGAQNTSGY